MKSAYSSSVSRVFTTWLRWGVLYRFGMGCKPPFTYHKKWAGLLAIFGAFPVCRTEIFLRRKPHSRVWGRHSPTSFPRGAKPQNCGFWHRGRNLLSVTANFLSLPSATFLENRNQKNSFLLCLLLVHQEPVLASCFSFSATNNPAKDIPARFR